MLFRSFTCAVVGSSMMTVCWGGNYWGQLGLDSSVALQSSPGSFAKLGGSVSATYSTLMLSCAGQSCCAVVLRGGSQALTCWGKGDKGSLGMGDNADSKYRKNIGTGNSAGFMSWQERYSYALTGLAVSTGSWIPRTVSMSIEMGCAVSTDGGVYCWGQNMYGAIGVGTSSATQLYYGVSAVDVDGLAKTVN